MRFELEYLPADLFGLEPAQRALLARSASAVPGPPPDPLEADERAERVARLGAPLAAHEPHVAVLDALRALEQPRASVVLVPARPAFAGGTVGVLARVLHAVRLARAWSEAWGHPVVPLLWNEADEHDLAPLRDLTLLNEHLDLRRVAPASFGANRLPAGQLVMDPERHRLPAVRAFLEQELRGAAFLTEALDRALPRPGETLAGAFTRWALDLFGPLGVVVVEPGWLREELARALAADLAALDPRALVELAPDAALVHRLDEDGRRPLLPGGDGFRYEEEAGSRTVHELAAELVQEPESWSGGGALLEASRARVLPVAARLGTLAEEPTLALAARLGLEPPPFVPALRATLLDPEAVRAREALGIGWAELVRGARETAGGPESPSVPIAEELREAAREAGQRLRTLRSRLAEIDRGLSVQLRRTAAEVEELVEELARRADRVVANRAGKRGRHRRRLASLMVPAGRPQDEVLGSLPFLARFGTAWLAPLVEQLDPLPTEHLVVRLGTDATDP